MKKISRLFYLIIKFCVRIFYPEISVRGIENMPDEPCIIVGNHAKMNGPIACELYFPGDHCTWTAGEMMRVREVPAYAYRDFWSGKPGYIRWFFRILSYVIAPVAACIFNNANCIGVYHDMRIISTFRDTVAKLEKGSNAIIFPEHDVPYNNIVWEFQDRFIDAARMYYRKTGKDISFVPMYVAPGLRGLYLGEAVRYDHTARKEDERRRVCGELMERITDLAVSLPEHTVVPYPNIPKKDYPRNKEIKRYHEAKQAEQNNNCDFQERTCC